eukprot:1738649-Pyramimonas_sp.AAC.1
MTVGIKAHQCHINQNPNCAQVARDHNARRPRNDPKSRENGWFNGIVPKPSKLEPWELEDLKAVEGIVNDEGVRVSLDEFRDSLDAIAKAGNAENALDALMAGDAPGAPLTESL